MTGANRRNTETVVERVAQANRLNDFWNRNRKGENVAPKTTPMWIVETLEDLAKISREFYLPYTSICLSQSIPVIKKEIELVARSTGSRSVEAGLPVERSTGNVKVDLAMRSETGAGLRSDALISGPKEPKDK